jgi:hypothetical protein
VLPHLATDVASTLCPFASSTRNIAFGRASTTVPSSSSAPSFFAINSQSHRLHAATFSLHAAMATGLDGRQITLRGLPQRPKSDVRSPSDRSRSHVHLPSLLCAGCASAHREGTTHVVSTLVADPAQWRPRQVLGSRRRSSRSR